MREQEGDDEEQEGDEDYLLNRMQKFLDSSGDEAASSLRALVRYGCAHLDSSGDEAASSGDAEELGVGSQAELEEEEEEDAESDSEGGCSGADDEEFEGDDGRSVEECIADATQRIATQRYQNTAKGGGVIHKEQLLVSEAASLLAPVCSDSSCLRLLRCF